LSSSIINSKSPMNTAVGITELCSVSLMFFGSSVSLSMSFHELQVEVSEVYMCECTTVVFN